MAPRKKAQRDMVVKDYRDELAREGEKIDPMADKVAVSRKIADRESAYHAKRFQRSLSPEKPSSLSANNVPYSEAMKRAEIEREVESVEQELMEKQIEEINDSKKETVAEGRNQVDDITLFNTQEKQQPKISGEIIDQVTSVPSRRSRWDKQTAGPAPSSSEWDRDDDAHAAEKIDETPDWEETPKASANGIAVVGKRSRWDATPAASISTSNVSTPTRSASETPRAKRSRWDETPTNIPPMASAVNLPTPISGLGTTFTIPLTPSAATEMEIRNQFISDAELDLILPQSGYKILEPPPSYIPIRTPVRKICSTPTPFIGYLIPDENGPHSGAGVGSAADVMLMHGTLGQAAQDLPNLKQEDIQFFGRLLEDKDETKLSIEELKERKIMRLLLRIKNGTPPVRKAALRHITDKARELGPGPLFNQILPLLMSPSLEDQERHLLVKVIDRIMYKLDELVRPYVHKILVVIEPLLIDEDYYARVEGREIISNLAKAAGLATMIATMRPDIDHVDEYVRNTTARAFAVVACGLGIPELLPFLKAVCRSKRSWQARHTGIKIIQQIALLMGCAVLPHLNNLVSALVNGIRDEHQKVRTMTALAVAALAEAAHPYGIESFDPILEPMFTDISKHRGKGLAAFLKAIGSLIPLMDSLAAKEFTSVIIPTVIREFQSPDEEMKKIVLKVIKQCVGTDGVEPDYIKNEILTDFFRHFWVRRMALDKRNYKQLVETTVELAKNTGVSCILTEIVAGLKDESEPFRKMVMDTADQIISSYGVADVDERLEQVLIDGVLYAFQEQSSEEIIMLNGFGTIVNALGTRVRPYLQQICSTILWRLNNKSSKVRQQAADLISRVAVVLRTCGEEKLLSHLGVVLYEYLGEEYPEVLGSILGALKAIVNVIGMANMNPPIKDLLPRLTPILRNRHEKVQENVIDLVGRIADRGAEFVSAREWMRICFELLDMLKAHKKAIRRATVNTFGYIAKAIGPQDVLGTLLNNLKVQERQNRVCTTVAIAIVAETCSPFTVLPGLMCEYRVPELNVQNGVLKSLSFLFEYIGEMGRDYVYAVTPLLEDALIDRDLVHRQTACTTVKHLALGVAGLGCEDALLHLLNHLWPNIFETSPHVINAVCDGIEALRVALGCGILMNYILAGLFHPARRLREIYWKLYNSMYIGAQDAMVAYYPMIQPDTRNKWRREELLYF